MKGLVRQFLVMCLLLTIALVGQAYGQTDPVTVVANSSVANSQISAKQLRRIFSMRQSNWANGKPIQVFVLPSDSEVHLAFCKQALSMFPYQIERMWNKFAYSGLGVKPIVVKNENEMLKMVAQTEGSIGYVGALKIPNGVITMTVVKE
jgi:ABC-type phosphate transport system substrate-binding protein